jgi:exodeoxyribonuclease VII small subunit
MAKSPSTSSLKFEQAIEQLEEIIDAIESGETGIEACLQKHEQGTKLIKHCRTILTAAEKKITNLKPDSKGGYQTEA